MKLIKMQCPNCNAALDIDIDNLQAYCPYCGTKLLFDLDQINQIIGEKEKTKRLQIQENAEVSKEKIRGLSKIFESDGFDFFLLLIGFAILVLVFAIVDKF